MEDVVVNEVPENKVLDRVEMWMLNDPPARKVTIEKNANGTYKITIEF